MTSIDARNQTFSTGNRPALVVVDDKASTRANMANALRRRFGSDYRVVESDDPNTALHELEQLRSAGAEAALILANKHLASDTGTDFLARTREAYPTARRLVLADFGDNWVMPSVARASTLGEVDHFDYLPVSESDERFLAAVGDILADWTAENRRGEVRMTIVGERGDPEFRLLGEVLQRWQTYPIAMLVAGTPEADRFMAEHDIDGPLPMVVMFDGRALTGATIAKVSDMVGAGADTRSTFDLAVVGLGPAGFSAAVNAASEGLRVIMINNTFSQASSSPMIRNYLGFPAGVTGAELMRRAWTQALMFGAVARIGRTATAIRQHGGRNVVELDDGSEVSADVVVLAIGVDYRRIGVPSVDRLIGRGVFYGFSAADAQAVADIDAAVVGGANSAVQAAVHLARHARSVHLLVRGSTLASSASEYLIDQVDALPNVTVHLNCEVIEAKGEQQLGSLVLRDRATGETSEQPVGGLFVMIGAVPRTDWLPDDLLRDGHGFVITGEDGPPPQSPEEFRLPFETTMPGVFALGDVRSGSVKRVAAAVGEGSAAIQQILRYRANRAAEAETYRQRSIGEPMPVSAGRT
ncbi:MAG TPA: FAD-dependent oxidoreductase [Candidatus Limnocylindrales bacterium]|nr:FAD-dependent oxidoreductase [Candidatus Limnocylindrales bacterium]